MADEWLFGDMLAYYRALYDRDGPIVLRPINMFVESTRKEMFDCLNELERHAITGEKLTPLQVLALELLIPHAVDQLHKKLS